MAKLDFFVRYPDFFSIARTRATGVVTDVNAIESAMVRHHYGPWDKRYYHVLAHLEAKQLISVTKHKNTYRLKLTDLGHDRANQLAKLPSFSLMVSRMQEIKQAFGARTGSSLKGMIYEIFEQEVGQRRLGAVIQA